MQDLMVTLVQTSLYWQDKQANLVHFNKLIKAVTETDLIILPEMFNTGFSMEAKLLAEEMKGETVTWMKQMAFEKNAAILGSLIIKENESYYNRLVAAGPDGGLITYDKRHLFRMADEHLTYSGGLKTILLNIRGWKIKPFICYDLRFPVWSRNKYVKSIGWDYDLAIYVANWPAARAHAWKTLAVARAIENQSYVISLNRIGQDGKGYAYSGDSQVINSYGESLLHLHEIEYVKTVTLSMEALNKHRSDFPVGMDMDEFNIE